MALRKALNEPKAKTQVVRVLRGAKSLKLSICSVRYEYYAPQKRGGVSHADAVAAETPV